MYNDERGNESHQSSQQHLSKISRRNPFAFCQAIFRTRFKLATDQWPSLVDGAHHGVAIQRRAPAVIQAQHNLATPLIGIDIALRHAGVGDKHHFQLATAGCAGRTSDFRFAVNLCERNKRGVQSVSPGYLADGPGARAASHCSRGNTPAQTSPSSTMLGQNPRGR